MDVDSADTKPALFEAIAVMGKAFASPRRLELLDLLAQAPRTVDDLAHNLDRAPVLVLACLDTKQLGPMADGAGNILAPQSAYASIFPAVQNLMLAARALGIGSVPTTLHAQVLERVYALLGIPNDMEFHLCVPLGYPRGNFGSTQRKPAAEVSYLNRWGTPAAWGTRTAVNV